MYTFYSVVWIESGKLLYQGQSLLAAAMALNPGTCYGSGPTQREARDAAISKAAQFSIAMEGDQ